MTEAGIQEKIKENEDQVRQARHALNGFSNLRLLLAIAAVLGAVAWFRLQQPLGIAISVLALTLFFVFVGRFNRQQRHISFLNSEKAVLDRYLDRFSGEWAQFPDDGSEFLHPEDHLSVDLDLFGPRSLYQYLNLGSTAAGKKALSRLLRKPPMGHIAARQHSVRELLKDDDYIVRFEAYGREPNKRRLETELKAEQQLKDFAVSEEAPLIPSQGTFLLYLIPILTILSVVLTALGIIAYTIPVAMVGLQIAPTILLASEISRRKDALLQFQSRLAGMQKRLSMLADAEFHSVYLLKMQKDLANASTGIRQMERIANYWQLRENFLLYIPLSGFLLWDFQCLRALEKWRKNFGQDYGRWLDWIGEVEALASLGTMGRINPDATVFPEISEGSEPELIMEDGKHPLIEPARVVGNDYRQQGETVIITGSNMSGKSTFMRTVGLNIVLAYAGGVVNARRFRVSPMRVFTSMRVQDNVGEGISTFYGEILRIKEMAEYAKTGKPMLVLIDEIFKGTNSADRIIGAEAAIRKLSKPWIMTLVTTHDFELCALVEQEDVQGANFHFQEYYRGDELLFDYIIRPGRTQTTNAKHLMRLAGLLEE